MTMDAQPDIKQLTTLMRIIEEFTAHYVECMATEELTGTQGLMLMRLGGREDRIGKLGNIYFGTNISYNVKKLSDHKYIVRNNSKIDKRVGVVSLTKKGEQVCAELEKRHEVFLKCMSADKAIDLVITFISLKESLNGEGYPERIVR